MKLTIIPSDGAVYKDGYCYSGLILSSVPSNVHALQWKDAEGWLEFTNNENGTKLQNEIIAELPAWANDCLNKWQEAESDRIAKETANAILSAEYEKTKIQPVTEGT
jgi:hypothetical protein